MDFYDDSDSSDIFSNILLHNHSISCYDIILVIYMVNVGVLRPGAILSRRRVENRENPSSDEEHRQLTQLYFNHLKNSWNNAAANLKK
ncbi:hypothetical protein KIN20_003693 [Parelaphostrongylus tenuis]|uniref:Uncharacterized protein n=1 Tax=Parelaphostrongylus tenuis TaxID=148309 RepID=A0AAD5M0M2_PARTN|nr:hypothetical protein KIN20_003693 [Parelaphostrongylus tenuis]